MNKYFTLNEEGKIDSFIKTNKLEEAIEVANKDDKVLVIIDKKGFEFIKKQFTKHKRSLE